MATTEIQKDMRESSTQQQDVEMGSTQEIKVLPEDTTDAFHVPSVGGSFWEKLSGAGVEMRGAEPVPVEKRTDTRYVNVFTVFATSMTSLLP